MISLKRFLIAVFLLPGFAGSAQDKTDTAQTRGRYVLGMQYGIKRLSYWDSLLWDAHRAHLTLYECRTLARLSELYKNLDNMPRAQECLNRSIDIAEKKAYRQDLLNLLLAQLLLRNDRLDKRKLLDMCYKGLKLAEELNNKRAVADFYTQIALHYFFNGNIKKALEVHFKCLELYREVNDHIGIAGALTDIGSDYQEFKNHDSTLYYYMASAKYAEELKNTYYGSYLYNILAAAYLEVGQSDSACKYSNKAFLIAKHVKSDRAMASAMVVSARALAQKGELDKAEKKGEEALQFVKSIGFLVQIPHLATVLKGIYLKKNNYRKAFEIDELYIVAHDSIVSEHNRSQLLQKDFDYTFKKEKDENKVLAQKYEIQALQNHKKNYVLAGLIILSVLTALLAYTLIRQSRIKSQQENVELEQKLLRTQMNPHFIFNSLSSIQQFIMAHQNDKAELYLSKFARLMRELLESTLKEHISVKEEIDILKGYIEMEALRFGNSFFFQVLIAKDIDLDRNIPLMMIQPFVENAIWHGLLPKKTNMNLLIAFKMGKADNTITCIIEDNGVGRGYKKTQPAFKKKSLALIFVEKRVALLRKTLGIDSNITIIDKKEKGESMGTKVILTLPLLKK